jgi:hypothetical protein
MIISEMRPAIIALLLMLPAPVLVPCVAAQGVSSFTLPLHLQSSASNRRPECELYLLAGRTSTRLDLDGQAYRVRPRCSVIGGVLMLAPDPISGAGDRGRGARLRLGLDVGYSWDPRPREVTDRYNDLGMRIPLLDPRHLEHRIYHALLVVQVRYPQYGLAWLAGLGGHVSRWATDLWSDQEVSINDWALGPSWQLGLQWGHLRLRFLEQRCRARRQIESITGSITRSDLGSRTRWLMIGLGS